MKGITYCGACADYDIKKHRCKCGAKLESNPQDKFFDDCPLPDAVPVVYGRWVKHYRSGTAVAEGYVSTCCDMWNNRKSDYCPNCGARMDGDDDAKES